MNDKIVMKLKNNLEILQNKIGGLIDDLEDGLVKSIIGNGFYLNVLQCIHRSK